MVRKACRWHLTYGGNSYCQRESFASPEAPFRKLDLGCDCDVTKHYQPDAMKLKIYGDPDEQGDVPRVEPVEVIEMEDED